MTWIQWGRARGGKPNEFAATNTRSPPAGTVRMWGGGEAGARPGLSSMLGRALQPGDAGYRPVHAGGLRVVVAANLFALFIPATPPESPPPGGAHPASGRFRGGARG